MTVYLFLSSVIIIGAGNKYILKETDSAGARSFNYSVEDSLFNISGNSPQISSAEPDKEVDYKQEVLDFNERDFDNNESKVIPAENSININTAGLDELASLPGIGEKTAQKIVSFRAEKGRISSLNELLDVNGIGQSKLDKIKKYLFID